jgi:periplasmic divalent cation tolerance protein
VTLVERDRSPSGGPMRLVLATFPNREVAETRIDQVLGRRLAACANHWPIESHYWWHNTREAAQEVLVAFKTVPAQVGHLFRYLKETHPYEVPEIIEVDVPRVEAGYLGYLIETLGPASGERSVGARALTHRAGRKAPPVRRPVRSRVPHRRPWRHTGKRS